MDLYSRAGCTGAGQGMRLRSGAETDADNLYMTVVQIINGNYLYAYYGYRFVNIVEIQS